MFESRPDFFLLSVGPLEVVDPHNGCLLRVLRTNKLESNIHLSTIAWQLIDILRLVVQLVFLLVAATTETTVLVTRQL